MARPERFELPTYCSGGNRSIQLSYGRILTKYTSINAPASPPDLLIAAIERAPSHLKQYYFCACSVLIFATR